MAAQHTALIIPAATAAFQVVKRVTPKVLPGQVLVRNKAIALNPVDYVIAGPFGSRLWKSFPAVVGSDGAGEIAQLGEGVTGWKVGDKVFYQSRFESDRGTFQELTIADAARIARVPDKYSYEEVVTLPLALATAAIGAYKPRLSELRADKHDVGGAGLIPPWEAEGRGKYAGQAAVIVSGSSSVGQFATQLAKLSGFSTIITTASKHNEDYCKSAGATHVIDYHDVPYPELPAAVKKIVGDTPLTYVYDAASIPESQKAGWDMLSPGGAIVVVKPPSQEIGTIGQDDEKGRRAVWVYGGANEQDHGDFGAGLYAALTEMLDKGELKPNKIEVIGHGLEVIPDGLARLQKGMYHYLYDMDACALAKKQKIVPNVTTLTQLR
ncbi:unnamed protein product [Peniophora sp. CBMAI 1063]|nr:unnamed protein product [Peniophora sp. CBMAI 1063]